MKTLFSNLIFVTLLLAVSPASSAQGQQRKATILVPKHLTLLLELQYLPGRDTKGSFWEVSYQWQIADKRVFDMASNQREDLTGLTSLGLLLRKGSCQLDNLSDQNNRQVKITVPVKGELLSRILNHGKQPQTLWLNATVRVYDAKLGINAITKVHTPWILGNYPNGVTTVIVVVTAKGEIQWSRPINSPRGPLQLPKAQMRQPYGAVLTGFQ